MFSPLIALAQKKGEIETLVTVCDRSFVLKYISNKSRRTHENIMWSSEGGTWDVWAIRASNAESFFFTQMQISWERLFRSFNRNFARMKIEVAAHQNGKDLKEF